MERSIPMHSNRKIQVKDLYKKYERLGKCKSLNELKNLEND